MGRRKKRRTHVPVTTLELAAAGQEEKAPRSLVLRKGRTTPEVATLVAELRRLMGPDTATRLRERRGNRMKDFAAVAGHLGLTHIVALTQTPASLSLRIARFPRGPTLTFKVERYSLQAHVRATQKRPYESLSAYQTAPLVVLNNFGDAASPPFVKLMKITFQNMFPPLNVHTVRLTDCRRVVLFDYNPETKVVEQRHFAIRAAPAQVNRSIKRLIQTRIPSLGAMTDISEFILGAGAVGGSAATGGPDWGGAVSDSEVEDEASQVVLPDKFRGRGNLKAQKSAIRLSELGPRLSLRLMKVERGFLEGDVIYHDYIKKVCGWVGRWMGMFVCYVVLWAKKYASLTDANIHTNTHARPPRRCARWRPRPRRLRTSRSAGARSRSRTWRARSRRRRSGRSGGRRRRRQGRLLERRGRRQGRRGMARRRRRRMTTTVGARWRVGARGKRRSKGLGLDVLGGWRGGLVWGERYITLKAIKHSERARKTGNQVANDGAYVLVVAHFSLSVVIVIKILVLSPARLLVPLLPHSHRHAPQTPPNRPPSPKPDNLMLCLTEF